LGYPGERRVLPRWKSVVFRFRLADGSDFRATAIDASNTAAAFSIKYQAKISRANRAYFQDGGGLYEVDDLRFLQRKASQEQVPQEIIVGYDSHGPDKPTPQDWELSYLNHEFGILWDRYKLLRSVND